MEKKPKIIKRYQNRKLYDTSDSCYVTLEDISEMIKLGDEVEVVDNETKEDLTAVTLAQIIFEEQKKKTHVLPLTTFQQIIRSGGDALRELAQKALVTGAREIQHVRHFMDDRVRPAMENIQQIPTVQAEIRQLRAKIDALEKKLGEQHKKKEPRQTK